MVFFLFFLSVYPSASTRGANIVKAKRGIDTPCTVVAGASKGERMSAANVVDMRAEALLSRMWLPLHRLVYERCQPG